MHCVTIDFMQARYREGDKYYYLQDNIYILCIRGHVNSL